MCSRLDPAGIYRNPADDYIRQGLETIARSRKAVLPGLSGLKSKSKSVETLIGNDSIDIYDDSAGRNGSWTDRDGKRIDIPRLDPLGQRNITNNNRIHPRDIENFKYSSLQRKEEFVLPPIPMRTEPKKGQRQSSFTMYVPDNSPASSANRDKRRVSQRHKYDKISKHKKSRTSDRSVVGMGREKSYSNFVNKFGEIKEEEGEGQYNYLESKSEISHDHSFRYTHSEDEEEYGTTDDEGTAHHSKRGCIDENACHCHFPDWVPLSNENCDENRSLTDSGVGASVENTQRAEDDARQMAETPTEEPLLLKCKKCAKVAPASRQHSVGVSRSTMETHQNGHGTREARSSSRYPNEGDLYLIKERSITLDQAIASGDVKLSNNPDAVNSIQRFKKYNQYHGMNAEKENISRHSENGYPRESTTHSSGYRGTSVASSVSDMSDGLVDQAWREKLSHQINDREGLQSYREDSDAPSVVIRSYVPSNFGDDDNQASRRTSSSIKLRKPKSSSSIVHPNNSNNPITSSTGATSGKRISFDKSVKGPADGELKQFRYEDRSLGSDGPSGEHSGDFNAETVTMLNNGQYQISGEHNIPKENTDTTYDQNKSKGDNDHGHNLKSLDSNDNGGTVATSSKQNTHTTTDNLGSLPKEAYERALAKAQMSKIPSHPSLFYLNQRITNPYTFSYFPSMVKVCPCCNKPVAEAADHNTGNTTSQNKSDKKNNKGNKKGSKKEKKTKAKKFNAMKHIFGNENVYDYYPGGKHGLR